MACPAFASADLDTGLIEREREFLFPEQDEVPSEVFALGGARRTAAGVAAGERARLPGSKTLIRHGIGVTAGG